nr:immunoglobulin light chain junction region [Macaca mulatta]MOW27384.1 immunoglobulin light chain junction region [Macaca mulatta]MOW27613.1 immunoglobulin light chain junction region [Macaca mulatta]MOW27789.1 immunoglobulin light chain junction region [Macaca mulatta]MOW27846.1 immunoglobulin light chain junction region [Macaca mulatta]
DYYCYSGDDNNGVF